VTNRGLLHPLNINDVVQVPICIDDIGGHSELYAKHRVHRARV
jgi:hypothetical protein